MNHAEVPDSGTSGPADRAQPTASASTLLGQLAAYREHDAPTHGGRVLSYVYDSGRRDLDELAHAAAAETLWVNGLDPTTFPSVALLEGDLVTFAREMLHGPDVTGSVTSGGTESCLLAVLAARELWRQQSGTGASRPTGADDPAGGARPRLVLPASAHAAFHKAAHLFGLDPVVVAVDPGTGTPRVADMVAALDQDGVALVVVSAPSYPHGVVDPVAEVAGAAADRGIPCHVDACIGGLVLPWWEEAGGGPVPAWDFAVRGVTSISADLHKYGFAPKGASLLLFADRELDRARYFALTGWPGYPVVNPTLLGTRSATALAAAWAVVSALGPDGYVQLTRRTARATARVREAITGIEGLRILADPVGPLLAVAADDAVPTERQVDPFAWASAVGRRGFVLQSQPGIVQPEGIQLPRSTHLTVTPVTEDVLPELLRALREAADEVRGCRGDGTGADSTSSGATLSTPAAGGAGGHLGATHSIPDPEAMAVAARAGGELDLAPVLSLIESLPRDQSADLLRRFMAAFTAPQ